jgi:alcohol dehydrogenase (NADP+)
LRRFSLAQNEGEVGSALAEVFSKWQIQRESLFITSKLWNTDHATARVEPAVRKCLKLLGLTYLDSFLIHWPITGNRGDALSPPTRETWQAMEVVQAKGLVRHLGVSNFSVAKMRDIMSYATVPLSVCQCESHPYFRNDAVVKFCAENRIHFTAFSPLVRRSPHAMYRNTRLRPAFVRRARPTARISLSAPRPR